MGAWILDSKAVSLGKITDTPKTDTRTKWEDVTYQLGGFLARHSAGEHVVKMALSILKHRLWVVEPAREHHGALVVVDVAFTDYGFPCSYVTDEFFC